MLKENPQGDIRKVAEDILENYDNEKFGVYDEDGLKKGFTIIDNTVEIYKEHWLIETAFIA